MDRIGVLQLTSSLELGGAERVALNLANLLPRERFELHLGTTRQEGGLAAQVAPHVKRLSLRREGAFDHLRAARELARYVQEQRIELLHCHLDTLFLASLATLLGAGSAKLLWHDHFGEYASVERSRWLYRLGTWRAAGVIAVNEPLARWSIETLRMPADRVWYLANFVEEIPPGPGPSDLPGAPGRRIVCVANLRSQKDHLNLLDAMARVLQSVPDAHALLVGAVVEPAYADRVRSGIRERGLGERVHLLGPRSDVPALLRACDIGVLSSESEGLPLSLIEYGMAGLASVATEVGQCADVLAGGTAGRLVPPRNPEALAEALGELLNDEAERARLAEGLGRHVREHFGAEQGIRKVCEVYEVLLGGSS